MCNRRVSVLLIALQQSYEVFDVIVFGRQFACLFQPLRSIVIVSLPQSQDTLIGPAGGLSGSQFYERSKLLVRSNIVANLQGRESDVKGPCGIGILGRTFGWYL